MASTSHDRDICLVGSWTERPQGSWLRALADFRIGESSSQAVKAYCGNGCVCCTINETIKYVRGGMTRVGVAAARSSIIVMANENHVMNG